MNISDISLTKIDQGKWYNNILLFLAPVATVYIVAVIGVINANHGVVRTKDFIPNEFTSGAMVLYVLNTTLDYLRKMTSK